VQERACKEHMTVVGTKQNCTNTYMCSKQDELEYYYMQSGRKWGYL